MNNTNLKALLNNQLLSSEILLKNASKNFSNEEFLIQLPNKGSSVYWIFGHLAINEDYFMSLVTSTDRHYELDITRLFEDDNSCNNLPANNLTAAYPSIDSVLDMFWTQTERLKQLFNNLDNLDSAELNKPAPPEFPKIFNNIGALYGMFSTHRYWHIGQIMALRTEFNEPMFNF